jgi:hypothetical protein
MGMFDDQGFDGAYDTAQVCVNGHLINDAMHAFPERGRKFCGKCGAATISECPKCKAPSEGISGVVSIPSDADVPSFCEGLWQSLSLGRYQDRCA